MSRIVKEIEIEGRKATALFDTGAWHTYVRNDYLKKAPKLSVREPYKVALGGRKLVIRETYLVQGKIEGLGFNTEAVPVKRLGRIDGHVLGAIIGAVTLEKWEIRLDPKTGTLDLEGLRRREFTEF